MKVKIPKESLPVIARRLNSGETYQSIADSYGVSKERIRQLKKELRLDFTGAVVRRRQKLDLLLRDIHVDSIELFFHSGCNRYDLAEECIGILAMKERWFRYANLPFDVAFSDIIWNRKCPYSGIELDYFSERHDQNAPVLDLINRDNVGYVKGNVHTVAKHRKSSKSMV